MESNREHRRDKDGLHRRRYGIWYFSYRDPATCKWHDVSTRTTNYVEARRRKAERLLELGEGPLQTEKRRLRLSAVFADWLKDARLHYAENTITLHTERSKPLLNLVGHMRLAEISLETLRKYQHQRVKAVANRTVNMEVQTLRNVLTHNGLWRGRLREEYKDLPENGSSVGRVLTDAEEQRCWEVAQRTQHFLRTYNLSVLLGNTGMRRSELLALRIEQVDLDAECIWIRKSKTHAGVRVVPLNEHAIIAATMMLELAKRKGACEPNHFLFPAYLHRRRKAGEERSGYDPTQHQKTFRSAWRHFTRECGLKGLRAHDRRHHFVTLLAEQGVPTETAMSMVGHMSAEMLRHYTHIRDGVKRQAVKCIDKANTVSAGELKVGMATMAKAHKKSRTTAGIRNTQVHLSNNNSKENLHG